MIISLARLKPTGQPAPWRTQRIRPLATGDAALLRPSPQRSVTVLFLAFNRRTLVGTQE
ncbi:hypothetical protein THTE_1367 [Thermogutta terrifontis]|uniref:Uncharacterized protein n=1 Tax=Thermogutta terrifontis TaxID=1331910 RepID=A0A286RDC9_9BACT|nr:hypothetical protein THTE_1367 [Thermogutta terrifontis]